jgi:alkanesulfonate monooxygenase SsuD/methylene tetrahydromethanopterin reductase-like flavin-dependent oxidoreductase (luciferase family)
MRYGFVIPTGDPRTIADLARQLEEHGWDGAFYWDGIALDSQWDNVGGHVYDPWVVMAAMAMRTEQVRLGAIVTPPSRRRPWKLARETMTLDHLSGGRLVVPVGLGAINTFGDVGEVIDRKVRAAMLDESLEILTRLWSGEPFSFSGEHYQVGEMAFRPAPVQRPRPPIWVVAAWPRPRSMARAPLRRHPAQRLRAGWQHRRGDTGAVRRDRRLCCWPPDGARSVRDHRRRGDAGG